MKQLLVLSGKGGTGKTTIASRLIDYGQVKYAVDCDIDAPNLHISQDLNIDQYMDEDSNLEGNQLVQSQKFKTKTFMGMPKYKIDHEKCISCGKCYTNCQFNAIFKKNNQYKIVPYQCEGCSVCQLICENEAIEEYPYASGKTILLEDERIFSSGKLKMGSGNSGKLVTAVKKPINDIKARKKALKSHPKTSKNSFMKETLPVEKEQSELVIIDGSPGIGCPVIASISGVDGILFVAEPSQSGIHDLKRVMQMARAFQPKMFLCINKFDLNRPMTKAIQDLASQYKIDCIGCLPYKKNVASAFKEEGCNNTNGSLPDCDCLNDQMSIEMNEKDNFDSVIASMYQYINKKMEV